jgi:hypothetical protein
LDTITALLDKLATKLGVAADQLWQLFLRQQRVEAISDTILAVLMIGGVYALFRLSQWNMRRDDPYDDPAFLFIPFGGIILFVLALVFGHAAFTEFYNPGYAALGQLTQSLKDLL